MSHWLLGVRGTGPQCQAHIGPHLKLRDVDDIVAMEYSDHANKIEEAAGQTAVMESRRLHVDGHEVAVLVANESAAGAPLVFLHGILTSIDIWPAIIPPEVRDARRWYALSLPGHFPGKFPPGFRRDEITSEMFTRVIGGAIAQVAPGEPVIVIGWSTGGFSALNLAAQDPDCVKAVMSISGFARGRWGSWFGLIQRLARFPVRSRRAADSVSRLLNSSKRLLEWFCLRGAAQKSLARQSPEWPAVLACLRNSGQNLDATAMTDLFARFRDIDISESLRRIRAPVLIVAGQRDPYVTGAETQHLVSLMPRAETRLVPDAGHMFFAEYRDVWRELLPDWLDRVERT